MSREHEQGMSVIVKTITRLTVGLILLYGIYILSHGHLSPGGGFAGGVIVALSFVHLMLAYDADEVPPGILLISGLAGKAADRAKASIQGKTPPRKPPAVTRASPAARPHSTTLIFFRWRTEIMPSACEG